MRLTHQQLIYARKRRVIATREAVKDLEAQRRIDRQRRQREATEEGALAAELAGSIRREWDSYK